MSRKLFLVVGTILLLGLMAINVDAKSLMAKVDQPIAPKDGQAVVVFLRSSFVGSAISASVFDVTTDETKFIGIVTNKTKIAYDVTPGEHVFMVVSESADFLKTTVTAGKTYYALITPRMGAWKARFSFKPLRQSDLTGSDFTKWDSSASLVENTPASLEWAADNAEDIQEKRESNWSEWLELPAELQDEMTIHEEDGR